MPAKGKYTIKDIEKLDEVLSIGKNKKATRNIIDASIKLEPFFLVEKLTIYMPTGEPYAYLTRKLKENSKITESVFNSLLCCIFNSCLLNKQTTENISHFNASIQKDGNQIDDKTKEKYNNIIAKLSKTNVEFASFNLRIDSNLQIVHTKSNEQVKANPTVKQSLNINQTIDIENISSYQKKYSAEFNKHQYGVFIEKIQYFEHLIYLDVFEVLNSFFQKAGFKRRQNWFVKKKEVFEYNVSKQDIPGGVRLVIIIIQKVADTNNKVRVLHKINLIGKIQEIELIAPKSDSLNFTIVMSEINNLVFSAYLILEKIFTEKAISSNEKIFKDIYDIIRHQLILRNKKILVNKFFLLLGLGKEDTTLYFFDHALLLKLITHFMEVESNGIINKSPLEMVIEILNGMFSFKKSLAIEAHQAGKPLSLFWMDFKYIDDVPLLHSVEMRLYNSEDCTGYVPCMSRGHYLIVGCATEYENEIIPEIDMIKKTLCRQFNKNLQNFSLYVRGIND